MIKITRETFCRLAAQSSETLSDLLQRLAGTPRLSATLLMSKVSGLPEFVADGDNPAGVSTYGQLMARGVSASDVSAKVRYTCEEWRPTILAVFPMFDPYLQHVFNRCVNNRVQVCMSTNLPVIKFYAKYGAKVYTVGFEDKNIGIPCNPKSDLVVLMWNERLARPTYAHKRVYRT